jgi:hypothetical protein
MFNRIINNNSILLARPYLKTELLQSLSCDPLGLLVSVKAVDEVVLGVTYANLFLTLAAFSSQEEGPGKFLGANGHKV